MFSALSTSDAVAPLLLPMWQLVIGALVLVALGTSVKRLARRGHSRMTTALLLIGSMIIGIAVLSILLHP
jgi:hypothetical protein